MPGPVAMSGNTPADVLKQTWGYDEFLPLQQEAIGCSLNGRDALVVLPTGGGKSICFQLPALMRDGVTVVVSPLISLMKDQVDALRGFGIAAGSLNSSLSASQQEETLRQARTGELKLLYLAPERLLSPSTMDFLQRNLPAAFAIDEAHCISAWGHDFRPEYRELKTLKERFAGIPVHAFTATATPEVRSDIALQLGLHDPEILVGDFHRRNLVYRVQRRESGWNQICSVIDRFRNQSGIIYAISRAKVEQISGHLNRLGYKTRPYHAGMTEQQRTRNQEALVHDEIEAIVATVAFGMGIDKSNVRYVIHAEMPKSIEGYQQESGRAGRDGLEAECWLLYSAGDRMTWQRIIENSAADVRDRALQSLRSVDQFCNAVTCRHKYLVEYFGQDFDRECSACDICLGQVTSAVDPLKAGQMILSCVFRCGERFGAVHVAKVLKGSMETRLVELGHDRLSTWGLMKETPLPQIRDWIDQLLGQEFLVRTGEYQVLSITESGWKLLRGETTPTLLQTVVQGSGTTSTKIFDSWEGVERGLFEKLREVRRELADAATVPAFIIFSDATLRDLARRRPVSTEHLRSIHGIGQRKSADYGERIMAEISSWCSAESVSVNVEPPRPERPVTWDSGPKVASAGALASFPLFDAGLSVEAVAEKLQRAPSTVYGYLEQYIADRKITDPGRWVDGETTTAIRIAATHNDTGRLRPIFEALHNQVTYENIRIVVACLKNVKPEGNPG